MTAAPAADDVDNQKEGGEDDAEEEEHKTGT